MEENARVRVETGVAGTIGDAAVEHRATVDAHRLEQRRERARRADRAGEVAAIEHDGLSAAHVERRERRANGRTLDLARAEHRGDARAEELAAEQAEASRRIRRRRDATNTIRGIPEVRAAQRAQLGLDARGGRPARPQTSDERARAGACDEPRTKPELFERRDEARVGEEPEEARRQRERERRFGEPFANRWTMHEARSIACFAWRARCIVEVMRRKKNKLGKNHRTEEIVAASGTVAGAVFGTVAGPVGTVAGAILGGVVGAGAGAILEDQSERKHEHEEKLDEDIGVYDGTLGAARPDAPPARVGAFSGASSGGERPSHPPSEGPMQDVDE